ncbi:MAG: Rid family hydrolase [Muribaculum sp.]|nr:Rid family hydrolase [Muribaculum sp.]
MERMLLRDIENGFEAAVSEFRASTSSSDSHAEYCVIVRCIKPDCSIRDTIKSLTLGYEEVSRQIGTKAKAVFKRYFLSDTTNQAHYLSHDRECAVSVVGQPPLDGSRAALWIRMIDSAKVAELGNGFFRVDTPDGVTHYWQGGACLPGKDSKTATRTLLDNYRRTMVQEGCSLKDDCMRTWFFVRDVDVNYSGVVLGRNEVFAEVGLTPSTHFIASTGIGGSNPDRTALVTMDTYTVKGLPKGNIRYLYAPSHLNPTYEYGVAFERGTAIDFSDRRHVLISGTASIDNHGHVVHPGDIRSQTRRMWENVETLLHEAGAGFDDVMQMIVYLRDIADYRIVEEMYAERFPDIPRVVVLAPVCRPEWLIEMECTATVKL